MDFFYSQSDGLTIFDGARTKDAIRRKMGLPLRGMRMARDSEDFFGASEVCVWYENNAVVGAEVYSPSQFFYDDVSFIGMKYQDIELFAKKRGWSISHSEGVVGVCLEDGRVRLFIPDIDEAGGEAICSAVYVSVKSH